MNRNLIEISIQDWIKIIYASNTHRNAEFDLNYTTSNQYQKLFSKPNTICRTEHASNLQMYTFCLSREQNRSALNRGLLRTYHGALLGIIFNVMSDFCGPGALTYNRLVFEVGGFMRMNFGRLCLLLGRGHQS